MYEKGFSLIELLIVVAIIGILAAIAIPKMLDAIQRSRQRATMADMHSIGVGIESYYVDHNFVPTTDFLSLITVLTSFNYIRPVPTTDHWDNIYDYDYDTVKDIYTLRSFAADHKLTNCPDHFGRRFECDIVFSNGLFVQGPD